MKLTPLSQSMSINVTYFDLIPYNSMVLTGPEVAIVFRLFQYVPMLLSVVFWYRVMASLLEKVRSSWT